MHEHLNIEPIGIVRTDSDEIDTHWRSVESEIHVSEQYTAGLQGIEDWSHLVIIFSMHDAQFKLDKHLVNRPRDRDDMPEVGVFAQRSRFTPNTIGMTVVRLLSVAGNVLRVKGLDAIDGTPVLSIKPYAPVYDAANEPLIPVWFLRLMQG